MMADILQELHAEIVAEADRVRHGAPLGVPQSPGQSTWRQAKANGLMLAARIIEGRMW